MAERWVGYFTSKRGDLVPHVAKSPWRTYRSRKAALNALREHLEAVHKTAQEKVAETGRALAHLSEMERI